MLQKERYSKPGMDYVVDETICTATLMTEFVVEILQTYHSDWPSQLYHYDCFLVSIGA